MRRVARFWLAGVVLGVGLAMLASPALAAEGPRDERPGVQQAEASLADLEPFTHSPDFFAILTWRYLQAVNHQVRTLGPMMNRLRSTGVYFTPPAPGPSFPVLPGSVVKRVQSKASRRGLSATEPPLMVGEFTGEDRADYAMIVNLSLARSANIQLETVKTYKTKQVVSAETGRPSPLDEKNGLWLPAGHGALIRLE